MEGFSSPSQEPPNNLSSNKEDFLNLHDLVALGEFERGLSSSSLESVIVVRPSLAEQHRLPLLLRLLSQARPLASAPRLLLEHHALLSSSNPSTAPSDDGEPRPEAVADDHLDTDDCIDRAVASLEMRAALYATAEDVETVTCHWAPLTCRKMKGSPTAKPPMVTNPRPHHNSGDEVDPEEGTNQPKPNPSRRANKKRRIDKHSKEAGAVPASHSQRREDNEPHADDDDDDDELIRMAEEDDSDDDPHQQSEGGPLKIRAPSTTGRKHDMLGNMVSPRHQPHQPWEDSPETLVEKTYAALTQLVAQSLQPPPQKMSDGEENVNYHHRRQEDEDDHNSAEVGGVTSLGNSSSSVDDALVDLSLSMDDAILVNTNLGNSIQQASASQSSLELTLEANVNMDTMVGGGAMAKCDLGSTLAALMHYAPALRHSHVASALCRAAPQQAPDLIARLGANCPAAVNGLIRGCLRVYQAACLKRSKHPVIAATARKALTALALLSPRERSRVRHTIEMSHGTGAMLVDLQLELALKEDPLIATCLVLEHLSNDSTQMNRSYADPATENEYRLINPWQQSRKKYQSSGAKSLVDSFKEDAPLLSSTLETLVLGMRGHTSFGAICLDLTCYVWITCTLPPICITNALLLKPRICSQLSQSFRSILDSVLHDDHARQIEQGIRMYDLLVSGLLSSLAIVIPEPVDPRLVELGQACQELLVEALTLSMVASERHSCKGVVTAALKFCSPGILCASIKSTLLRGPLGEALIYKRMEFDSRLDGLSELCKKQEMDMKMKLSVDGESPHHLNLEAEQAFLLCEKAGEESRRYRAKSTLTTILMNEKSSSTLIVNPALPDYIELAVNFLCEQNESHVPLVLPLEMEKLAARTCFCQMIDVHVGTYEALFLLQLLYVFHFLEADPVSPFRIDLRVLPLKQIMDLCAGPTQFVLGEKFIWKCRIFIDRFCPEVRRQARIHRLTREIHSLTTLDLKLPQEARRWLVYTLRKSMLDSKTDPSGLQAENAFLFASHLLSESALVSATVEAFQSFSSSPPQQYSYGALCRDPLIALRARISAWRRPGLRRVVLAVLFTLLDVNDVLVEDTSPDAVTQHEYLDARDEILVRCFLKAAAEVEEKENLYCPLLVGLIRRIVTGSDGAVALLLKQGISDFCLDWFVERVPEAMDDSAAFLFLLSERSTLSTPERLIVSDGILRLAIAYGHLSSEEAETELAYTCLSQLIASFFLVMGPVGVPVNALIDDRKGFDATHVARRVSLRMMRALLRARGYRHRLRNECVLALQKLAGLCKGESLLVTVSGPVSARQKVLLRDMLEATTRALEAMGASL